MKKILAFILGALLLTGCSIHVHQDADVKVAEQAGFNAIPSVVILSATSKTQPGALVATGFAIDDNRIVTAGHFCLHALELQIFKKFEIKATQKYGYFREITNLEVDKIGDKEDLCIINAPNHNLPPLKLSKNFYSLKEGDDVLVVGAPMGVAVGEFPGKIMEIVHSGFAETKVLDGKLIVSSAATGGISGSPIILQKTGEVIGVLVMGHPTFDHLSAGVPVPKLFEMIK